MAAEHNSVDERRSPWRDPWVWAVFVAAVALRFTYLVDLAHTPFFDKPQMDALYHDQWAKRIAAGDWQGTQVFFRAPLYPYFLGIVYALVGADYFLVRVIQFLIGGTTALLTTVLPYRGLGRRAAITAGFLVAFHGPLIYFEGELLLVVLEAPLNLLAVWTLDRAITRGGARAWVVAGAMLAVAALVRPTLLVVPPVVAAYLLWRRTSKTRVALVSYAAAILLVLSPVLVRNYVMGKDIVPVASQGGLNYYLGNNSAADGMSAIAPNFRKTWSGGVDDARRQAELARGRPLKPSEVSRYWFGRALTWARDHPGDFVVHQLRKLGYFWDSFEIPNNQDFYFFSELARIFRLPLLTSFFVLGPLALAGLALALSRGRLGFAWVSVPLLLMAVIVGFFVCARFRAPLVPLFAVWAGTGLWLAVDAVRAAQWKPVVLFVVVLGISFWAVNGDTRGLRARQSTTESHLRLGIFYAAQGDRAKALEHYEESLAADSTFADGWNNLGVLHAQEQRMDDARHAFSTALRHRPGHPKALSNLAALAFQQGHGGEADSLARETLRVAGREPSALYNAAVVLGNLGDADTALLAFRSVLRLEPWNSAARVGEARALLVMGRKAEAVEALEAHPVQQRSAELKAFLREVQGS